MLMPLDVPMKLRMSRRPELLRLNLSGVRSAGLRTGTPWVRACCRIVSMAGRGRDFSIRSRIVRSSSPALLAASRLVGSSSTALLYSNEGGVELVGLLELAGARDVIARRVLRRPLELDLVFGVVRARLQRLGKVHHRRIPVARPGRLAALAEGPARGTPRDEGGQHQQYNQPAFHELGSNH